GGNRSFYHYGNPRPDLRIGSSDNCSYCHQNTSTAFNQAMINPELSSYIYNHSGNPSITCDWCHISGWIHNASLTKPVMTISYCLSCHSSAMGTKKPIASTHNNTVNCWNCHQDPNGTMARAPPHGMMYPQENGSYLRYTNGTPADCTTCHVSGLVNTTVPATGIPTLNHSNDPSSGQKWGNYWDNNSMLSACTFCHQTELHKPTDALLGNVSNVRGTNILNDPDLSTSTWCSNCHYRNSTGYNVSTFINPPPEITNTSLLNISIAFFDHTGFSNYNDSMCYGCHSSVIIGLPTTLNFSHGVSEGGGGPNCISCHDKGGIGAPPDKRIDASSIKQGVHKDLNINSNTNLVIDPINKACWACHGEGTEPSGHPQRYKNPRACASNECHSLDQSSYNEPMIYSHFTNSSLNNNPTNATNYNITASADCAVCHLNSIVISDLNKASAVVSHYGSRKNLVDSFNCRYCHLDKDNSNDWGNATLITRNRTSLIKINKEENKITIYEGEMSYLGEGYFLKLIEISQNRESAFVQLIKNESVEDETLLTKGIPYSYEKEIVIENSTFKTPIILLNVTSVFKGSRGFIQFDGSRIRKVHSEKESQNNSACFACHFLRYTSDKQRYQVIDREYDQIPSKDLIYYTQVFQDFKPNNKSKLYFDDENYVFNQSSADKFISYMTFQKLLKEGETWDIAADYSLKVDGVSSNGEEVILTLKINDIIEQQLIKSGTEFNYSPGLGYREFSDNNVTIFAANVSAIGSGNTNYVILKDVIARSPVIFKTTANSTIMGYNASWLNPVNVFIVGKIPENLHSPNLFTDQGGWNDCVKCHDTSRNLRIKNIDAISARLGKHSSLNNNASNEKDMTDPIDKACWACHSNNGLEPSQHSPSYINPRNCRSCHVLQKEPFFGAIFIGDEQHGNLSNCETCHIQESHTLMRFNVNPVIKSAWFESSNVTGGDPARITAESRAGYMMKIRAAEYFIDTIGQSGKGTSLTPLDKQFDTQKEMVIAKITNNKFAPGEHVVYIHAMERNNIWGEFYPLKFTIMPDGTLVYKGKIGPIEGSTLDEDQMNIQLQEDSTMNILSGILTSYAFNNEKNPIVYVNITSNIDAGEIRTTIEVLRNTSSLVTDKAPGEVYKNINIGVGPYGFAVPENLLEGSIEFKVANSWLNENSIKDINLYQYVENEWKPLQIKNVGVKGEYTYYSAKTRHFSSFAISGITATNTWVQYENFDRLYYVIFAMIIIFIIAIIIKKRNSRTT
ncbi:MAG: PGF-pre-PGF domain-containing protein, partial [Candidatus Methanoperedens sp.]|nr:PGF-pre-PGF domain-containing protein [Candidatus Methanoperedens sp.]